MALVLGIDLGTSYFKVGLFDEEGALKGLGRTAVDKVTPSPGRFELPVPEFWRMLRRGLDQALTQAGARAMDISALSYSSQANTFVLLDRHAQPLTPLIFWTDSRAEPVEDRMAAFALTDAFRRTIGWKGIPAQAAVAKWRWFARHHPAVWEQVKSTMTISDYLTFALTGERAGDASTAAFLGLYDLVNGRWWPDALAAFDVDRAKLSTPLGPGSPCGHTTAQATSLLGVPAGIPFAVGALDHHAAAIGAGLGRLADLSISTGTVLAALALVDALTPCANCYHGPHVDGRRFYRLAFDPAGAGQLDAYREAFAADRSIEQLLALAEEAGPGSDPVRAPPAPRSNADHGAAVRHLLERVAATHRTLVRQLGEANRTQTIVATGGGARSPLWVQIKADVLGVPVVTTACPEPACLGAAAFAAVAARRYATISEASLAMVHPERTFEPNPEAMARGGAPRSE